VPDVAVDTVPSGLAVTVVGAINPISDRKVASELRDARY
jgi:hypothetical protein